MNKIYVTITEITDDKICGKFYDSVSGRQMLKKVLVGLIIGHFGNNYAVEHYNGWARLNLNKNCSDTEENFCIKIKQ
jgi:hypothetical protein